MERLLAFHEREIGGEEEEEMEMEEEEETHNIDDLLKSETKLEHNGVRLVGNLQRKRGGTL